MGCVRQWHEIFPNAGIPSSDRSLLQVRSQANFGLPLPFQAFPPASIVYLTLSGSGARGELPSGVRIVPRLTVGQMTVPVAELPLPPPFPSAQPDFPLHPFPHDIRLFFPATEQELWTSSNLLRSISPYFQQLLTSDFLEATTKHRKRARDGGLVDIVQDPHSEETAALVPLSPDRPEVSTTSRRERDVDDSDDETDDFLLSASPTSLKAKGKDTEDSFTFREIRITEAAYSTYRAILVWAYSGYIQFAPLLSSRPPPPPLAPDAPSSATSAPRYLHNHLATTPSLPLPVSPKSVYRLAHFLEIAPLARLALSNLDSQLSISNCAAELFSDTSIAYDEVRNLTMGFAVRNWATVRVSDGFREVEQKVAAGEMGQAAPVLMQLLRATSS
ncbi:hypothetical protein JCM8097_007125 [Rhodosporidiobolus ruineniae]